MPHFLVRGPVAWQCADDVQALGETADPLPVRPHAGTTLLGALFISLSAACTTLAPPYTQPAAPVPEQWLSVDATSDAAQPAAALAWDSYFTDPLLRQLIETALDNNRDLRLAVLRVEEARAGYQIQHAGRLPQINASGQAARARIPADLSPSGRALTSGEYRAELGTSSWELDLWGRVRSLNEAALQQWLATQAGSQAARTALIAQVASTYLDVREMSERVTLARRTVATRQESFRIFSRRFEVGSASKLELTQVQMLLTQAQSLLAQLEQARAAYIHALAVLVGADPGPLSQATPFDETLVLAELAPGLPSELLNNRPDILAAEHRLIAAHANIGAARAAFFPRIALTGSLGSASSELDGLFSSGSGTWSFVPVLSLPIFDGGRRQASLELAEVRREMAVAEYEKTIQTAFREVSDALSAQRWLREQLELQRTALTTAQERARLAQLRYDNGATTYLEVLDAQRELLSAEQQLVEARRALLANQVRLYVALGGGAELPPSTVPTALSSSSR